MMSLFTLWPLAIVVSVNAICPPRVTSLSAGRGIFEKVNVYDGIQPVDAATFARQTNESVAEINRRYDATNIFACETAWGNGALVRNQDTIIAPLHTLYVDRDCSKPRSLSNCGFLYQGGGKDENYSPLKIIASGGCPKGTKLQSNDDWVIIKLAKKLPRSVKPYGIPESSGALKAADQVVIAGKSRGFNPNESKGELSSLPKAFANCTALGISNFNFVGLMQTNCPSDKGCSGCAIVSPGPSPKILSLNTGEIPTEQVCMPSDGPSRSGPSQLNCRASRGVPIDGALLNELRKLPSWN